MRKCLRCESVMVEDLVLMGTDGASGTDVREKGIFKMPLAKVKCAVCPECGYVETYVDNTKKIKELIKK